MFINSIFLPYRSDFIKTEYIFIVAISLKAYLTSPKLWQIKLIKGRSLHDLSPYQFQSFIRTHIRNHPFTDF